MSASLMGFMLCWLVCLMTTSALFPSYLTDHLKLDLGQMGIVMSSIGLGAAAGTLTLPWLSDFIGRKPVMLLASVGAAASLWALSSIGSDVQLLFWALFCVHFFNNALITLTVGPICAELTPAHLVGTAAGIIIATGEFFGGGVAPVLAGFVAETFGIGHILWLPMAALMVGFVLALMLKETRPRRRLAPV